MPDLAGEKEDGNMSKRAPSLVAICPFYKDQERQKIICEGLEQGSSLHLTFATPDMRRAFEIGHCKCWDYEKCPLAEMHSKRYSEEE